MGGTAMDTIASLLKYIALAAFGMAIGAFISMFLPHNDKADSNVDVSTEVKYDTIPYYIPVPVDSYVTRYEVVKLPAVRDTIRDSLIYKDTLVYDSVNVIVPITQKKYEDSTYTAYVSGFNPQLDSIKLYQKTIYQTITEKPARWGIGLVGGYGYGIKGFTPFAGIAVYYKLFEFKSYERRTKAKHDY